ncbi:MAG: GumN family protein, partial [Caulobacteraceae bacterium]|nr:GumN family protein [Caulobacteraceae bacterium]
VIIVEPKASLLGAAGLLVGLPVYFFDKAKAEDRLPPDLYARFQALAPSIDPLTPAHAATLLMAMDVSNAGVPRDQPRIAAVSPTPENRAAALAKTAKVKVSHVAGMDVIALIKKSVTMPEKAQQACLAAALDDYPRRDVRKAADRGRLEAWAQGDVPGAMAGAKSASCPTPDPVRVLMDQGRARTFAALNAAMVKPGKAVAVVDIHDLLAKGGVLDQLKAKGYAVTAPDMLND